MTDTRPLWLTRARAKLGVREIVGRLHSATILGWLKTLNAWWAEDETPWCGAFVAICLREVLIPIPKAWYRALDWSTYGQRMPVDQLAPGAVLVFGRDGGGHVGFYLGEGTPLIGGKPTPAYRVLGGNQGNRVCEAWIAKDRLVAARWPLGEPVLGAPVHLAVGGALSTAEV